MKPYLIIATAIIISALILSTIFFFVVQPKETTRLTKSWGNTSKQTNNQLTHCSWGTRIVVKFEDGSYQQIHFIEQPIFTIISSGNQGVEFAGKKVSEVYYILEAKAEGNISNVLVKFENVRVRASSPFKLTDKPLPLTTYSLPVNSNWTVIQNISFNLDDLFGNAYQNPDYSNLDVNVEFRMVGKVYYKLPSTNYYQIELPKPVNITFKFRPANVVDVSFNSRV